MNEDRMRAATDDELDARLSGYFTWQSAGLRDIPSAQEVAVRIADGSIRVRRTVSPGLAWAILALIALWRGLDPGAWVTSGLVVIGLYFISVGLTEKIK